MFLCTEDGCLCSGGASRYESITEAEALDECLTNVTPPLNTPLNRQNQQLLQGLASPAFCQLVTDLSNLLAEAASLSSRVSPIDG
jgi:hypothetical protein